MFQAIHRIGQWKKVGKDGEREWHVRDRKEDSAEKDHWEAEEVGHGHRLKNLFYPHGDKDSKQ